VKSTGQPGSVGPVAHYYQGRLIRESTERVDDAVDILVPLQAPDGQDHRVAEAACVVVRRQPLLVYAVRDRDGLPGRAGEIPDHQVAFDIGDADDGVGCPEQPGARGPVQPVQEGAEGRVPGAVIVRGEDERQVAAHGGMADDRVVAVHVNDVEVRRVPPQVAEQPQRERVVPGGHGHREAEHPGRTDPLVGRGIAHPVGEDHHLISGFGAALSQALDVRLHPADQRMVGRDDLRDPQRPLASRPQLLRRHCSCPHGSTSAA
jgi:hypothetical protein